VTARPPRTRPMGVAGSPRQPYQSQPDGFDSRYLHDCSEQILPAQRLLAALALLSRPIPVGTLALRAHSGFLFAPRIPLVAAPLADVERHGSLDSRHTHNYVPSGMTCQISSL
jgi:hypothetical protein